MDCIVINWEYFYNSIKWFTCKLGYKYILEVEKTQKYTEKNVPADASLYTYKLLKVISKEKGLDFSETKDKTIINFIEKYIKNNKTSNNKVKYTIAKIDLNADKTEEVFVSIEGKDFCGTGGCTTLLLKKEKNDYKLLNDFWVS